MAALAVAGPPLSFGARPVQPRSAGITGAFGLGALRRLVSRSTTRGSRRSERAGASPSFAAAGLLRSRTPAAAQRPLRQLPPTLQRKEQRFAGQRSSCGFFLQTLVMAAQLTRGRRWMRLLSRPAQSLPAPQQHGSDDPAVGIPLELDDSADRLDLDAVRARHLGRDGRLTAALHHQLSIRSWRFIVLPPG
jgi:hypothetical protein